MDERPASEPAPDPLPARGRGNGLSAAAFVPLVEMNSRLVPDALTLLAGARIGAYSRPAGSISAPEGSGSDELLCDAGKRSEARDLLVAHFPGVIDGEVDDTIDATFAALVTQWDTPLPEVLRTRSLDSAEPTAESESSDRQRPAWRNRRRTDASPAPETATPPTDAETEAAARQFSEMLGDTDHYHPPQLGPLPRMGRATRWALLAIIVGVLMLLAPLLIDLGSASTLDTVGILSISGGVAAMISRLSNGHSHDGDDGAVV
jgi:hypothetical protein